MAVVDYFLKIDGIEGEAQDKTHKNEIQPRLNPSTNRDSISSKGMR